MRAVIAELVELIDGFELTAALPFDLRERAEENARNLRNALELVEYVADAVRSHCPWCDGTDPDESNFAKEYGIQGGNLVGHRPDCPRQIALLGPDWAGGIGCQ